MGPDLSWNNSLFSYQYCCAFLPCVNCLCVSLCTSGRILLSSQTHQVSALVILITNTQEAENTCVWILLLPSYHICVIWQSIEIEEREIYFKVLLKFYKIFFIFVRLDHNCNKVAKNLFRNYFIQPNFVADLEDFEINK